MQAEGANGDGSGSGSEQTSGSAVALRKIVKRECQAVIRPLMEDMCRKVVKEISSAIAEYLNGDIWFNANAVNANAVAVSNERSLHLKFLDEVSDDVLTGKEIKGKAGTPIRVAIFDKVTGQVIDSGPESSAKVEILFLESSGNDDKNNWSHEDFNSLIIKESDKTKPHFAKSYHVYLEKGIGVLSDAKSAHDSKWTKSYKCRLGARVVENLSGIKVQEAWTEPFVVSDKRGKLYEKHYPPLLSDFVWRLDKLARDGEPCKRLNENKVSTVRDFLLLHCVDPRRLQEIIGPRNPAWKAIVAHALTCNIEDDKRIGMYKYNDSSKCNMSMVFDFLEGLKGVIQNYQYVLINHLPEAEKVHARELLRSAFENQHCITFHSNETTLMPHFLSQASFAATTTSIQENYPGYNLTIPENMNQSGPTEAGTSSQGISPFIESLGNANNISDFASFGLTTMRHVDHLSPDYYYPENSNWFSGDLGCDMSLSYPEGNNLPETRRPETLSFQQSDARMHPVRAVVLVLLWMLRARKRVMALGQRDIHASKRQRI